MSTIANAKVEHNYNRYNGYFFGCLRISVSFVLYIPYYISFYKDSNYLPFEQIKLAKQ